MADIAEAVLHHHHRADTCPMRDRIDGLREVAMHRNEEMERQLHDVIGRMEAMNAALTHTLQSQDSRLQQIASMQVDLRAATTHLARVEPDVAQLKRKISMAEGMIAIAVLGLGLLGWFTSTTLNTLNTHSASIVRVQEQHGMMMQQIQKTETRVDGLVGTLAGHVDHDERRLRELGMIK